MDQTGITRRDLLIGTAVAVATIPFQGAYAAPISNPLQTKESSMTTQENTVPFTKTAPPEWLLAFWKEIDDKTFGKGFDCFAEDAVCNLGVADWHGREAIRKNLKAFIDTGFTAHHDVVEYWDGGPLKVFRGIVTMRPDDPSKSTVKPSMAHFFYMDKNDPTKVSRWIGAVGPVAFLICRTVSEPLRGWALATDTLQGIMPGIVNKGRAWQLFDVSTRRPPGNCFYPF